MIKKHFLILEALLKNEEGLTREELSQTLQSEGEAPVTRKSIQKDIAAIYAKTGIRLKAINLGKNVWRYTIDRHALEDYDGQQLLGNLLANMMQAEFLQEFRDLGSKIQPVIIARGTEYLRPIGVALRGNRKLKVVYQKFDDDSYEATLHPYCLKVFAERWYLFAQKESTTHEDALLQCFALDRIQQLTVTSDTFLPNPAIDPKEYFRDAYGIWVDPKVPAQYLVVACTPRVANYLRSLPLHHTQHELNIEEARQILDPFVLQALNLHEECKALKGIHIHELALKDDEPAVLFLYHISPTPDFISELNKWGEEAKIVASEKETL